MPGVRYDVGLMLSRSESSVVSITLALVVVGMPACGDSPDESKGDGSTHMDAEGSDAALGSGGSGATTSSGGSNTDASPPGSGGMSGAAADSSAGSGGDSGGTAGTGDASIGGGTGGTSGVGGTDAGAGASSTGTGGTDAGSSAGGTDGSTANCGDGGCAPIAAHVHIYISNTCEVSVDPVDVTVPQGQSVLFTYHNHSVDYEADVWMSYGGGYIGLVQGGTWTDPIERCSELFPYTAYADVSINGLGVNDPYCPGQRMTIHCE